LRVVRALRWSLVAALLAALGGCKSGDPEPAELDVLGTVPDFAFTDQTGAPVRSADLRGRVHVAHFIFTRCPSVCPTTTLKMERLGERLAGRGDAIHFLSFSIDPEHDTPPVLAAFAARFHADPARWKFLTGPPDAVRAAVVGGFRIAVERDAALADGTPNIVHGTHFVLLDRRLRIRGYYDSDDAARLDQLAADAEALAREP
jgi:protein SCO1